MAGRALVGLVLCLGSGAAAMATSVGPTVHTAAGELQGAVTQGVAAFRGVQYAQAPVGQLRWRDPRPVGNWSGVRPALADGPGCPQVCKLPTIACPPVRSPQPRIFFITLTINLGQGFAYSELFGWNVLLSLAVQLTTKF